MTQKNTDQKKDAFAEPRSGYPERKDIDPDVAKQTPPTTAVLQDGTVKEPIPRYLAG